MNDALGQDAEIALIRGLTHHLIAKSFVDVGAERGSVAQAMFSCGLSGTMFEPLPKHFKGLETMARVGGGRAFPWARPTVNDLSIPSRPDGYSGSQCPSSGEGAPRSPYVGADSPSH